jgi:PAS domain S-box-containing protein
MEKLIRILHLEDVESDAILVNRELKKSSLLFEYLWVSNQESYKKALVEFSPDIILSDHSLASYTSLEALQDLKNSPIKIPFILITGTMSEEFVVKMMKEGIHDYLLKDRIQRLPNSILNAMEKINTEREKEKYFNEIIYKERKYRALIENISDAILLVNEKGCILYNSPSVKRIVGFEADELLTRTIFDFFHPLDVRENTKLFQTALANPSVPIQNSYRVLHKNGGYIWTEGVIINLLNDDSVNAFIVIYRDVTQRKTSEQFLQKSEANLKTIFNNTNVSYVFTDREFRIVSFNKNAAMLYKKEYNAQLQEGKNLVDYLPEEKKDLARRRYEWALKGEKINYEINFSDRESGFLWHNVNIFPVLDETGNVLGLIIATEDITERKLTELERGKMTEDIFQRNQDLEQFANIISHNLRSPVANIIGLSNLILETDNLNKKDHEKIISGLAFSTKKLDEIIIDLNYILELRQEINEKKQVIEFSNIVNDVTTSVKDMITGKNIIIETDFKAATSIFTVKSYLYSIFYNLISNSIKYRKSHGAAFIKIRSAMVEGGVAVTFEDNGIGIDLKMHGNKLFGLYKKFHSNMDGKGMGLYMVKTQVEILGGKINVRSEVDKGSVFQLNFKSA